MSILLSAKLAVFFEHEISSDGNFQQTFNNILLVKNIPVEVANYSLYYNRNK